ncbi:uncharacterized protein LY89DRAFT_677068 [Mollisia scopiformis]|uniref:Uncharacterized protein n=1 Tax=Mollisia scopiformis TaxID=149040 RepID=A0A132B6Z3_MOLSC|nr:uncharacterized protein LY89DRAFT_677068 [Mollisia scopiformis]KUJ08178.1 hypothetical protein LY89DRAFT_677068 [Mollisia scopiformis]
MAVSVGLTIGIAIATFILGLTIGVITCCTCQRRRSRKIGGLKPGESIQRYAGRKVAFRFVEYVIQKQEEWYQDGEGTKKWFLEQIPKIDKNQKALTPKARLRLPTLGAGQDVEAGSGVVEHVHVDVWNDKS